jgi:hypothetical protein
MRRIKGITRTQCAAGALDWVRILASFAEALHGARNHRGAESAEDDVA